MMRARRSIMLLLVALVVAGCTLGSTVDKVESARSPEGASLWISARNVNLRDVELLEVQDSALLVRVDTSRIAAVHYRAISSVRAGALGTFMLQGRPPIAAHERTLRAISRFPQGLSGELLERLLAGVARADVEHIR